MRAADVNVGQLREPDDVRVAKRLWFLCGEPENPIHMAHVATDLGMTEEAVKSAMRQIHDSRSDMGVNVWCHDTSCVRCVVGREAYDELDGRAAAEEQGR